jgi:hypothetical protein
MNRLLICVFTVLIVVTAVPDGNAQSAYLQVYFDEDLTETTAPNCPLDAPGTVVDELYVVAHGFDAWLSAIEFRLALPSELIWLGDVWDQGHLALGSSPTGIAIAFPVPVNAFAPVQVLKVVVVWMCQGCGFAAERDCASVDMLVCVDAYPSSGYMRAVTWPDQRLVQATSGTAIICPLICGTNPTCPEKPVPVESTTWGRIKAQYR